MKLKYIPLTILLAALTTGCNESRFLDITPSATLNGDNVATKENVHLLTTAAYSFAVIVIALFLLLYRTKSVRQGETA